MRRAVVRGAIGVGLAGPALAQEADCAPVVTAEDFRLLADDAWDALLADDAGRVERVLQSIRAQVRCLGEPVPSRAWARVLYGQALVAYAQGEAWEPLVTAALLADRTLLREVGPPVVRGFEPEPGAPTVIWRPAHGEAWVDGRPVDGPIVLEGPHILQWSVDGRWTSRQVDDGAVPDALDAVPAAVEAPPAAAAPGVDDRPRWAVRLHAGVGLHLSTGPEITTARGTQPPVRLSLPVEVGVGAWFRPAWVRVVGAFSPQLTGPWVVQTAEGEVVASPLAGGGHLAGGGRIGVGHLGALVGLHGPGRVTFQAVGGADVWPAVGLRLEARAGVHYTTGRRVEPAIDLAVTFTPRLASGGAPTP